MRTRGGGGDGGSVCNDVTGRLLCEVLGDVCLCVCGAHDNKAIWRVGWLVVVDVLVVLSCALHTGEYTIRKTES